MAFLAGAAAGVALLDYMSSKGQTLSITDNITTSMSVNATTNVVTDCFVALDSSQTIDVKAGTWTAAQTNALSEVCAYCQNSLSVIVSARDTLEGDAEQQNGSYTAQQANPDVLTMMVTGGWPTDVNPGVPQTSPTNTALGPCTAVCANVVVVGVVQQATLQAQQNCTVKTDLTNNVSQNIQGQISAYLKNQQDIVGQLESAFTSNSEAISANLASTMSQSVTNNFIQDLNQAMYAFQSFKVTGNSVIASNVTQSFTGDMVGTLNVSNTVNDQLRQSASYSIAQSLLNKNDTIGDLSTDFLQVINTMTQMMEELTTQILIIIAAVLAAVMLVVGSLYVFNQNFHSWASHAMGTAADAQLEHFRLMQTDATYRAQVASDQREAHAQDLARRQQKADLVLREKKFDAQTAREQTEQQMLAREQGQQHQIEQNEYYRNLSPDEQKAYNRKQRASTPYVSLFY